MEGFLLSIIVFALFKLYGFVLARTNIVPETSRGSESRKNRWLNIFMSLTHSLLSGAGCVYCYVTNPQLFSNPLDGHTLPTKLLVSFSWGYFLHDLVHTLICRNIKSSWDIVLHHVVVLFCHGLAISQDMFINFACVSLFCELNSVFLHSRQLLKMSACPAEKWEFRLMKFMNFFTYLFVRMPSLAYLSVTVWELLEAIHPAMFYAGFVGGVLMNIINVVLLWRLLKADVFGSKQNVNKKLN